LLVTTSDAAETPGISTFFSFFARQNAARSLDQGLIQQHENAKLIQAVFKLKSPQQFIVSGNHFTLGKIGFVLYCKKSWYSQRVREHVTLGEYDHLQKCIRVPSGHGLWIGPFDKDRWKETDKT